MFLSIGVLILFGSIVFAAFSAEVPGLALSTILVITHAAAAGIGVRFSELPSSNHVVCI